MICESTLSTRPNGFISILDEEEIWKVSGSEQSFPRSLRLVIVQANQLISEGKNFDKISCERKGLELKGEIVGELFNYIKNSEPL